MHAFATDPARGLFILAFLGVVIGGALALYAWRAPSLDSQAGFRAISRETFLLLNNVLLVIATTLVLIGTLFPLVSDVLGLGKVSIGPPWFEIAFSIPMLPLVVLMGLGMHTAWRQQPRSGWRVLRIPAIAAVVGGIGIPVLFYDSSSAFVFAGSVAAVWIMAASVVPIVRSSRRAPGAPAMTRSMLGMNVAHFGVGLFTLGVTVVSAFSVEADRSMTPGQTVEVAGYEFELRSLRDVDGPNYRALEAEVDIRRDGAFIDQMRPQKRIYLVQQNPMTEAGIQAGWNRDLFIALGDSLGNNAWSVRIQYKPLIRFIWFGCLLMAFGGIIAASDRRYRLQARVTQRNRAAPTEGSPA